MKLRGLLVLLLACGSVDAFTRKRERFNREMAEAMAALQSLLDACAERPATDPACVDALQLEHAINPGAHPPSSAEPPR